MRRALLGAAAVVLLAGFGWGTSMVHEMESTESTVEGDVGQVADLSGPHRLLAEANLLEGQSALFEVCAQDGFSALWSQTSVEIWTPSP